MTFPVIVEPYDGQFVAALVGAPTMRAVGPTRDQALATLQADLTQRLTRGELVALELAPLGVTDLAGTYHTDPTLRDICAEAYHRRDTERDQA
jgi:hypothetical protein